MLDALHKACMIFKSQHKFASEIGVSQATVNHWLKGIRKPKAEWAIKIENATNGAIKREQIRPDIFG